MNVDLEALGLKSISKADIDAARQELVDRILPWVADKYPKIRLVTIERNAAAFAEIKKYDDQCKLCVSTAQCPTLDGNRMNGRLMPDGVVTIWMEPCPLGHRPPKHKSEAPKDDWRKRKRGDD